MNIDPALLQSVVAKSILDALGKDGQESVVAAAVQDYLLKPRVVGEGYNRKELPSPLIQAFYDAADRFVRDELFQRMKQPENPVAKMVDLLISDVTTKFIENAEARLKMAEEIVSKIGSALQRY